MTPKEQIVELRKQGKPCSEIAVIVGKSTRAVQQAVFRAKLSFVVDSNSPSGKRYDWEAVQDYYDSGHDRYACLEEFKITPTAWDTARKTGRLKLRPKSPREDVFKVRKFRSSTQLRYHLRKLGWLKNKCALCPTTTTWNGKPLVLQIDHMDGDHANNSLGNLRELCPNCHTQTDNYGSKNKRVVKTQGLTEAIMSLSLQGKSQLEVARLTKSTPNYVAHILNGWKRFRYT